MSGHRIPSDITLELNDVTIENVYEKFEKAVASLDKALHVHMVDENVPEHEHIIPAVNDYEDDFAAELIATGDRLIEGIARDLHLRKARSDDEAPFHLPNSGKVITSLRTGKPLTVKEWRDISDAIDKYLRDRGIAAAERAVRKQTALGALINRLEKTGIDPTTITRGQYTGELDNLIGDLKRGQLFAGVNDLPQQIYDNLHNHIVHNFARTADYVTSVSDRERSAIKQTIVQSVKDRDDVGVLISKLFRNHGELNRDWRRVARTESRAAYTDGYIGEEYASSKVKNEPVYFMGQSAADACPVCIRDIQGKIVKMTDDDRDSDIIKDRHADRAIWLGKTSVGHKAKEKWTVIPRHPHCRCRWVRWYPEMADILKVSESE
jgi:hypothetical protein